MARIRVYRHHIRCPDCGANRMRWDGFSVAGRLAGEAPPPLGYRAGPIDGQGRR